MDSPAVLLLERLGLTDDELCTILAVDPIAVITGDLDHRPELPILLALTDEPAERLSPGVLQRWVRTAGPRAARSITCSHGTSPPSSWRSSGSTSAASSSAAAERSGSASWSGAGVAPSTGGGTRPPG